MPAPRRLGVSYSRFSDPRQGAGDSTDRQDKAYRAFCERHNLTPGKEVYADRGRSGYTGEHRKKGRLGHLVEAARHGAFEKGTVVVIEAWDRLGRMIPNKQVKLIEELLEQGIDIGICRLDDIFSYADFGTHKWTTLAVFVQLAYQESKQKAERLSSSWASRRDKARTTRRLIGHKPPGWIEFVDGEARLIPERVATLRRIFKLAAEGHGHARIVRTLREDRVPAFGERLVRPDRMRSDFSGVWLKSYVGRLLSDRRVVGEFQPMKAGKADGPPIAGYYPAAITPTEFLLARAAQAERINTGPGRAIVPRDRRHVNVFRSLLTHARDGASMLLQTQCNHGRGKAFILVSGKARETHGERHYSFPYLVFEEQVLTFLKELDPRTILPRTETGPSTADALRAKLGAVREDIANLQRDLRGGYNRHLADLVREATEREEAIANELTDELARTARPLSRTWDNLPTLVDAVREGGDEARLKLRPALRALIESAHILLVPLRAWRIAAVQFVFAGGAVRHYGIAYRPAVNRAAAIVEPFSFATADLPAADLRNAGAVRRLEKLLVKHGTRMAAERAG